MRNNFLSLGMLTVTGVLLTGCEKKQTNQAIDQFERPQDVALVCYDNKEVKSLPLGCCRKRAALEDSDCDVTFSSAKLYAFVTQTTAGEVAVVDVEEQAIVGFDELIPYNSFIPVGDSPNDIVATGDGERLYTANYESGNVSVITVVDEETGMSVIHQPYLSPAPVIDVGGPASKLFLVQAPAEYQDRFALVTQPTLGRLSVLALDSGDCPESESRPNGCLLGYLHLNEDIPDPGAEPSETEDREIHPFAIAGSDGPSVYVGSYDGSVIWDVQTKSLIDEALALGSPGPIDPDAVLNDVIPIAPNTTRALSLEPRRQRWLYAIENQSSSVIAINLEARRENPELPPQIVNVGLQGKGTARAVVLVELEEEDEIDPLTFNGTFGIVSTSNASIVIIDVDDRNASAIYPHPHTMRSAVNLMSDAGVPKLGDQGVTLLVDEGRVDKKDIADYIYFAQDGGVAEACDAGAKFRPVYDNGVKLRCDPFVSKETTWTIKYGGEIGVRGVGVITNILDNEDGPWRLLNDDETYDFCAQEIYVRGTMPGYLGDVVRITSTPAPIEGFEDLCDEEYDTEHELLYRVVGVEKYDETSPAPNVLAIERDETLLEEPDETSELIPECYGQALSFEILAGNHWIIGNPGFTRTAGAFDESASRCAFEGTPQSELRVMPDTRYENRYITFRLKYGEAWAETGPASIVVSEEDEPQIQVASTISFKVEDGYEEMFRAAIGNDITDIVFTPDNEILLVDRAGQGLIMFDLIDDFDTIGGPVN